MPAKLHLCLVSNQPVPSLTTLIDPSMAVQKVLLVAGKERQNEVVWLSNALREYNILSEINLLDDSYDLAACQRDFADIVATHPQGIVANITGGTKIMTIAAWEALNREADELYYVDIRHDCINWLKPHRTICPIADRINLKSYLLSIGMTVKNGVIRPPSISNQARQSFQAKLSKLIQLGKLPSVTDAAQGGQWLEHYVYDEIIRYAKTDAFVQDIAASFKIYFSQNGTKIVNELDVMCLRDNTAFVFECKTGKAGTATEATKAMYKLAQLCQQLAGMRGRGVFVTTEAISPLIMERAQQFGIEVIQRRDLPSIQQRLQQIFTAPHFDLS